MGLADDAEEGFVGLGEVFFGGGIVVVVEDEGPEVEGGDGAGDGGLASTASGEAEVDLFGMDGSAEEGGIVVAGARGASALGDGGAIEEDGLVRVWDGREELRAGVEADLDGGETAVEGKVEDPLLDTVEGGIGITRVEGAFEDDLAGVGLSGADVFGLLGGADIEIEACGTGAGHMIHVERVCECGSDGDGGGIGAKPDASAGGEGVGIGEGAVVDILGGFEIGWEAEEFAFGGVTPRETL